MASPLLLHVSDFVYRAGFEALFSGDEQQVCISIVSFDLGQHGVGIPNFSSVAGQKLNGSVKAFVQRGCQGRIERSHQDQPSGFR